MKDQKYLVLACLISIIITIILLFCFIFNVFPDINLIFTKTNFQILLILILLFSILSAFFLKKILVEIRYELDEQKQKEKNIHDIYLYNQLLDPPSNNN